MMKNGLKIRIKRVNHCFIGEITTLLILFRMGFLWVLMDEDLFSKSHNDKTWHIFIPQVKKIRKI